MLSATYCSSPFNVQKHLPMKQVENNMIAQNTLKTVKKAEWSYYD